MRNNTIKKYNKVQATNHAVIFAIKRMETIFDKTKGQPDEPHRHDYYTIVLTKKASGKHIIDFQAFELQSKQVYFISPNQVHQIIETEKSYGFALTFSRQFMVENGIDNCFIEDLHLFQDFGYSPPLVLNEEELQALSQLSEEMLNYVHSNRKFKYQAVGALLKLFLIQCNNVCSIPIEENTQTTQAAVVLLRDFKALLDENYKKWHKVNEYANALHITSDYLNVAVKSLTGKTAKEHIQSRIITAAKRLLRFSSFTNKVIAYELGFSEPANFSQFFKKCTGMSPTVFRSEI